MDPAANLSWPIVTPVALATAAPRVRLKVTALVGYWTPQSYPVFDTEEINYSVRGAFGASS
jgi:hypothetical protein